ncbi:DNA primase [Eremococcus coleocola]|uniref:DNA primase n=1 Tax=Eremococcus coleocola TaxID=88132 RepID=UPI0004208C75|nr:DNA primase [Eremococcus coleocola]
MAYLPEELITRVRQEVNIVDVVNQYVQLKKQGSNYTASCPFHEDRNPSFSVSESKQIYKCFSCGRGGNVFGFIQEIEGLDFVAAVQKVADMGGVILDQSLFTHHQSKQSKYQSLYQIHEKTASFYHYYLTQSQKGQDAFNYLTERKVKQETIDYFQLGAAPDKSELLWAYLEKEGFSEQDLLASGIFYQTDSGQILDRFRGRLIIPLKDMRGQVVAFSGRVYQSGDHSNAKYLNSPETAIFNKSKLLFNHDGARASIRQKNQVLVCEGYMDVIALHQAGFHEVVASMGTSLTQDHLTQLSKMTNHIYFIFDGDEAGQKATQRAFDLSQNLSEIQVKALILPGGQDPDEFIQARGQGAFQDLLNQAQTAYDFVKRYLAKSFDLSQQGDLSLYIQALLKEIQKIPMKIEQELRLRELAQEFDLSENLLKEQFERLDYQRKKETTKQDLKQIEQADAGNTGSLTQELIFDASPLKIRSQAAFESEKILCMLLIYYEEAWPYIERLASPPMLFHDFARRALMALEAFYYEGGQSFPLTGIIDQIEDRDLNHFFTQVLWDREIIPFSLALMDDCLKVIDREFKYLEVKELQEKLLDAQKKMDKNKANQLMIQMNHLLRQLKN